MNTPHSQFPSFNSNLTWEEVFTLLLDNELSSEQETFVYSAIVENESLRETFQEFLALRKIAENDAQTFIAPPNVKDELWAAVGYNTPAIMWYERIPKRVAILALLFLSMSFGSASTYLYFNEFSPENMDNNSVVTHSLQGNLSSSLLAQEEQKKTSKSPILASIDNSPSSISVSSKASVQQGQKKILSYASNNTGNTSRNNLHASSNNKDHANDSRILNAHSQGNNGNDHNNITNTDNANEYTPYTPNNTSEDEPTTLVATAPNNNLPNLDGKKTIVIMNVEKAQPIESNMIMVRGSFLPYNGFAQGDPIQTAIVRKSQQFGSAGITYFHHVGSHHFFGATLAQEVFMLKGKTSASQILWGGLSYRYEIAPLETLSFTPYFATSVGWAQEGILGRVNGGISRNFGSSLKASMGFEAASLWTASQPVSVGMQASIAWRW
jgi:hypothetical protein